MTKAYEQPAFTSKAQTEADVASGDRERVVTALIGAALEGEDRAWVEGLCLRSVKAEDRWVRKAAATAAGHLARIHGALDPGLLAALAALVDDPEVGGDVQDSLDDISTFLAS